MKSKNSHRNDGVRTRRVKNLEELHEKMFVEQESENYDNQKTKKSKKFKIQKLPLQALRQIEGDSIKKKLSTGQIKVVLVVIFVGVFVLQGLLLNYLAG